MSIQFWRIWFLITKATFCSKRTKLNFYRGRCSHNTAIKYQISFGMGRSIVLVINDKTYKENAKRYFENAQNNKEDG